MEIATRRSGRVSAIDTASMSRLQNSGPSTVNGDGDDTSISDFPSPSKLGEYMSAKKSTPAKNSRESLSSVATTNDDNEGSGYSTPATALATPTEPSKPSTIRRGRRVTAMAAVESGTPGVSAIARAAALRNSQYSLTSSSKRKRVIVDSDEDEDDQEIIDAQIARAAADAQLAKVLQEEEYAAADSMAINEDGPSLRRTPRKAQNILPKVDFASDFEDEDFEIQNFSPRLAKRPKIELGASGSNAIKFDTKGKGKAKVINDSEDSDGFFQLTDSEEDLDAPIPIARSRTSKVAVKNSPRTTLSGATSKSFAPSRAPVSLSRHDSKASTTSSALTPLLSDDSDFDSKLDFVSDNSTSDDDIPVGVTVPGAVAPNPSARASGRGARQRINLLEDRASRRSKQERKRLETHHPELHTMWKDLDNLPKIGSVTIEQPKNINRALKPFQLQGVAWMKAMETTEWGGGLLGDEMGMGKTIQAVSLIMSDWPASKPSLVLIPPVALMQWQQEIASYTDGTLRTFVFHGTNAQTKGITVKQLKKYDVILLSYNSLESMYRKQEKGFKRKNGLHKEKSPIHQIDFHRVILDEAHNIKTRTTGSAKACFALKADHKWCLSGTPLQNRIGEFFSLVRFLDIRPFACYFCKQCSCSALNWEMNADNRCTGCNHSGMQHVSVFNQELLNPIQKFGNKGPGKEAFRKLRILTDRFMLRRVKRDHSSAMELPAKEIYVDRQFFGEEENDFAGSIMNNGTRKFETYVAQGVLLNNYANIFGLIMQMRQVADHPDLILKKNGEGGQNVLVCCICDETAEEAIRSSCRHDFCRECAKNYLHSSGTYSPPSSYMSLTCLRGSRLPSMPHLT
jgi:DNA repair protein RAD16